MEQLRKSLFLVVALSILEPNVVSAQRKSPANRSRVTVQACRIVPSASWVKRQAEWFDESAHRWTNDTLRVALLNAAALAAPLTAPVQLGVQVAGRDRKLGLGADAMVQQLKALASTRGSAWPTKSVVGAAGVHAVYLVAESDTALARSVLHRLMEAGPSESPAADVATLEDRLRILSGRKQIYGTQFRVNDRGAIVLAPMEDSAHADLRRDDAGLPPFTLGLCLAKHPR
jgi:hypothetical protein